MPDELKPVFWVGSAAKDWATFPADVQDSMGYALQQVQEGRTPQHAKPLKGFGGGVLELIDDFDGDTFRGVYTVRFPKAVYVLHAFQKKSKRGSATPKQELDLIERRLKRAEEAHEQAEES